jgi:hypothetical protein
MRVKLEFKGARRNIGGRREKFEQVLAFIVSSFGLFHIFTLPTTFDKKKVLTYS